MGTGDHSPIYSKQYPASNYEQEIKFQETQKLLERGQIEEFTSPWSSPIVLVKKKDKTIRFCIDYQRLNAITIKDAFPLARIDKILDQLPDEMYYTKFDFKCGYFHVPLTKETSRKLRSQAVIIIISSLFFHRESLTVLKLCNL